MLNNKDRKEQKLGNISCAHQLRMHTMQTPTTDAGYPSNGQIDRQALLALKPSHLCSLLMKSIKKTPTAGDGALTAGHGTSSRRIASRAAASDELAASPPSEAIRQVRSQTPPALRRRRRRPARRRPSRDSSDRRPPSDAHKKQTRATAPVPADELDDGDNSAGSNDVELDMPRPPPSPHSFYKLYHLVRPMPSFCRIRVA
jgi:hypothetical protein